MSTIVFHNSFTLPGYNNPVTHGGVRPHGHVNAAHRICTTRGIHLFQCHGYKAFKMDEKNGIIMGLMRTAGQNSISKRDSRAHHTNRGG
jgi:hypothetical protein